MKYLQCIDPPDNIYSSFKNLLVNFSQRYDSCHASNGENVKNRHLILDKAGHKLVCKQHNTSHSTIKANVHLLSQCAVDTARTWRSSGRL